MHEPKASALRHRDRYYIVRVRHIKTRSPAKCVTSRMLEHYGASVSEVADNTEARSQ